MMPALFSANAILLSAKGYTITQLQEIFAVYRDTVSAWVTRFERFGMTGLQDLPRSGCPHIYTDDEVLQLAGLDRAGTASAQAGASPVGAGDR